MSTYAGSGLLNGPLGAKDSPERYRPRLLGDGVPTTLCLVIEAESEEEALDRQVLWHLIQRRIDEMRSGDGPAVYWDQRPAKVKYLEGLAERVLRGEV